jgi:hypothetical protein
MDSWIRRSCIDAVRGDHDFAQRLAASSTVCARSSAVDASLLMIFADSDC